MINIIVAASENNVIGSNNQLPWKLPNDMKFFKQTTMGFPVIMGRLTFDSMGKALPGRTNIVMTMKHDRRLAGAVVVNSLNDAISWAKATLPKEIFIIGGGQIFEKALAIADRVYLTRVHAVIDGDTYFPELQASEWSMASRFDFPADEKHAYAHSFEMWLREK